MKKSIFSQLAASGLTLAFVLGLGLCSANAQDIQWQQSLDVAVEKAKSEKKLVLLHFTASWCRPCQTLNKFVFRNLDVARTVNEHVVGVQIDVDREQSIVTEYGVTAVPFDIVITPGGRVIRKQKSPLDSNGYRRMMADLATPVKEMEDKSNVAIAQQLNDFSKQFDFKPEKLSEFQSHTPEIAKHQAPNPSADSAQLARRSHVENPFFTAKPTAVKPAASKPQPSKVSNSFVASPAISAPAQTDPKQAAVSAAKPVTNMTNDFVTSKPAAPQVQPESSGGFQLAAKRTAPKLGPPTLESSFEEITGAEQEAAFRLKPDHTSSLTPDVSPLVTLKPEDRDSLPTKSQPAQAAAKPKNTPTQDPPNVNQSAFAATVTPKKVQQDRFFQQPAKVGSVNQTRVVPPSQMAQRLLQPVKQYPQQQSLSPSPVNQTGQAVANATTAQGLLVRQPKQKQTGTPKQVQQLLKPQHAPSGTAPKPPTVTNVKPSASQPGLHGMCPVTLLQKGQWVPGDAKHGCIHRDRLYLFATAEKLKEFRAAPDRYSPILAGYDPVVFHQTGQLVDGLAKHGVFMKKSGNQRVLLFSSSKTRDQFQQDSAAYLNTVRQAMNARGGASSMMR